MVQTCYGQIDYLGEDESESLKDIPNRSSWFTMVLI